MHIRRSGPLVCAVAFLTMIPAAVLRAEPQAAPPAQGAQSAASAQANTHIYRISVFRSAPGQIRNVEKLLTSTPAPGADAGDFAVLFRHRQGSDWDFMTVEHMGEQATIDLKGGPPAQPDSPLSQSVAWHGDTYAAGPPLDEFRRALNLTAGAASGGGTSAGVYVVSDYMAAVGHRGQLRKVLDDIAAETPGRSVTLSHVEGAPWNFLMIARYDSWQQFGQEEEAAAKGGSTDLGLALREHLAVHHDTLATIQAVMGSAAR